MTTVLTPAWVVLCAEIVRILVSAAILVWALRSVGLLLEDHSVLAPAVWKVC